MLANALRSLAAEFGLVRPKGAWNLDQLTSLLEGDDEVPEPVRRVCGRLLEQLRVTAARVGALEAAIAADARRNAAARRLSTIPGIGPIAASPIAAIVGDGWEGSPAGGTSCRDGIPPVAGRS